MQEKMTPRVNMVKFSLISYIYYNTTGEIKLNIK